MLLAEAYPRTLAPKKKKCSKQHIDGRQEQDNEETRRKAKATAARQMDEKHSIENEAYNCGPTKNLAKHIAKVRAKRPSGTSGRDDGDCGNDKENKSAKPSKSAETVWKEPRAHSVKIRRSD